MGSSVKVALGWVDSDIAYGYDEDWTFDGFHPIGYSSTDLYLRDVDTRTADLRLLSAPEQGLMDGGVDWVLGLFVLNKDVDFARDYTYASGLFISDFGVDRVAVYGELATDSPLHGALVLVCVSNSMSRTMRILRACGSRRTMT